MDTLSFSDTNMASKSRCFQMVEDEHRRFLSEAMVFLTEEILERSVNIKSFAIGATNLRAEIILRGIASSPF
ncbi:MAG: hypothetical protein JNL70_18540 [Saprospiraceae bacterium]|nr:hypothetical protein [Saprospiraceae bacterium]